MIQGAITCAIIIYAIWCIKNIGQIIKWISMRGADTSTGTVTQVEKSGISVQYTIEFENSGEAKQAVAKSRLPADTDPLEVGTQTEIVGNDTGKILLAKDLQAISKNIVLRIIAVIPFLIFIGMMIKVWFRL